MSIETHIESLIAKHPVTLFMKGTKEEPRCGFSAMVVQILTHLNIPFHDEDVLGDEQMRQGIKDFSNWPTVPQLYVQGEFIGGCDIVREMFEAGELDEIFAKVASPSV